MAFQFPANPTIGQQFAPTQGVTYEWNGTGWIFLGLNTASLYPAGIVLPYAGPGPTLPFQGWLLCDGATYATSALPVLFAVIGYTYGGGGANFQVPDLRGRVVAGPDTMGTATGRANRLGGAVSSIAPGGSGGLEAVNLQVSELAPHAHGITDVTHNHAISEGAGHSHVVNNHQHAITDVVHGHGNDAHSHGNDAHGHTSPAHAHAITDVQHTHGYVESSQNPPGNNFALQGPGPGQVWKDNSVTTPSFSGINATQATAASIDASGINIHNSGINIHGSGSGITVTQGLTAGLTTQNSGTGIGLGASGTGLSTTTAAGSGGGHLNLQPTLLLNYIIKT